MNNALVGSETKEPPASRDGTGMSFVARAARGLVERQPLTTALTLILVLVILLCIAGFAFTARIDAARQDSVVLLARVTEAEARIELVADLDSAMGYTHFIHDFKNGVLRGDADRMREAQQDLDVALQLATTFERLEPQLQTEMAVVHSTLSAYRRMSDLALDLIHQGLSPREIDAQVRVDDTSADAALRDLHRVLDDRRAVLMQRIGELAARQQSYGNLTNLAMTSLALVAVLIAALTFYVHRQARPLLTAARHLADIEARLGAYVGAFAGSRRPPDADTSPARAQPAERRDQGIRLATSLALLAGRLDGLQQQIVARTDELTKTNAELDRFAFVASHDLQEPLRKIEINIDLLQTRYAPDLADDVLKRLDRIGRSAADMRQLIEDLLWFSRSATRPLRLQRQCLAALVQSAAADTADRFLQRGGSLRVTVPEDLQVDADKGLLVQVFVNLLTNAAKFTPLERPPVAEVTAVQDGDELVIAVTDNGIGFDRAFAEQMFEPFQRLHGRAAYEGNGIGLSIVRRVVERHSGTVTAAPRPEGGAVFTVRLPAMHLPTDQTAGTDGSETGESR